MAKQQNFHNAFYKVIKTGDRYGIIGQCDNQRITVEGLTTDLNRITAFVEMLNQERLELCHLKEVANDYLCNPEFFTF